MKTTCNPGRHILLLVTLSLCLALAASTNAVDDPPKLMRADPIGADFSQWRDNVGQWQIVGEAFVNEQNNQLLASKPGAGVLVNGPTGRTVNLLSKEEFGDVKAHIELMVPKGSNSGIYFQGRYEIQVFDSWQVKEPKYSDCGGIYERWDDKRTPQGYEGHAPRVNASLAPGQWQSFDIVFRAPRFDEQGRKVSNARFEKVVHNGVIIHEDVELYGPTRASTYNDEKAVGPLMLQGDHGPVAYRNIRLEPAGANPFFAMDTGTKDAKHQTFEQQVQMLKELGYAGFGCTAGPGLDKLLEELDKNGLRLFTVYTGVNIDPDQQKYDPKLPELIQTLKDRNTILWLFLLSNKLKPSSIEGDERAVQIIREIAEVCANNGARVALYPHQAFWLEKVGDAVRIAKKVERRNVGVTFNLCHWLRVEPQGDIRAAIQAAMPYLSVVTVNGADKDGKDWKQLIQTLDRGTFDVREFLKILDKCGYNGPIGLQHYGIGGDAHENLERSIQAWRKLTTNGK
jgi:sugar phosphate isomerase/epimerase